MLRKFHIIEVGLSGTGEVTTSFEQDLHYGLEAATRAIVSVLWLGIQAKGSEKVFIHVIGSNDRVTFSCAVNKNPPIESFILPEPFTEE